MTDPTALPNFPTPGNEPAAPASNEPVFAGPGEPSPTRDRVLQVLETEGFRPEVDGDGDVSFKVEGQQLFVRCIDGQPAMIRVFGQWQIGDDVPADLTKRLLAANDVTLTLNIIKAGIANGNLVVTGEHLVSPDADLAMLVQSTTQMVIQAVQMWHQAALSDGPHAAVGLEEPADPQQGGLNGQG